MKTKISIMFVLLLSTCWLVAQSTHVSVLSAALFTPEMQAGSAGSAGSTAGSNAGQAGTTTTSPSGQNSGRTSNPGQSGTTGSNPGTASPTPGTASPTPGTASPTPGEASPTPGTSTIQIARRPPAQRPRRRVRLRDRVPTRPHREVRLLPIPPRRAQRLTTQLRPARTLPRITASRRRRSKQYWTRIRPLMFLSGLSFLIQPSP